MFGTYEAVRRRILATQDGASGKVLDLCCGTGYVSNHVRAQRVVGLDLSMNMLRVNKEKQVDLHHVSLVNGNAYFLPFRDGQFDAVFCTLACHEFSELPLVLKEVHRVLGDGGRLTIFDIFEPANPLLKLLMYTFFKYIVERRYMWLYSQEGWRNLLGRMHFGQVKIEELYYISALIQASKERAVVR